VKPLACQLDVFDAAERRRYETLRAGLGARRLGIQEVPDGIAVLYPAEPELFVEVAEWVTLERRCCPFLSFSLEFDADSPSIRLRLVGGEDVEAIPPEPAEGVTGR
jgi:hypothetical protein